MTVLSGYKQHVRDMFGTRAFAAWPPDSPYELGMYGRLLDGILNPIGNINDLGLELEVVTDAVPSSAQFTTSRDASVKLKTVVEVGTGVPAAPQAAAILEVTAASEGSLCLLAPDIYFDKYRYPGKLEPFLKRLYREHKWHSGWHVITAMYRVPEAKLFVARTDSASAEFQIDGDFTGTILNVGKASVELALKTTRGTMVVYSPARNATPVFELYRLAPWPFGVFDRLAPIETVGARLNAGEDVELWHFGAAES